MENYFASSTPALLAAVLGLPGAPPTPEDRISELFIKLEPEPDRTWTLNRSHITGSDFPDSVDPAQYLDINPDIRL